MSLRSWHNLTLMWYMMRVISTEFKIAKSTRTINEDITLLRLKTLLIFHYLYSIRTQTQLTLSFNINGT